jgi:DNA-binding LytR/AlgR family response regulator
VINPPRPLRVMVVDDEPSARKRMRTLAAELGADVVGDAANGLEALERLAQQRVDVVLLDVEMPEVDGLDVARRLPSPRPFIVFATAYDHYAAAAFEAEALDFVLKPVSRERLAVSFERAIRRLGEVTSPAPLTADVVAAVATAMGRENRSVPRRLLVRHLNGHRLVALREIDRFYATDNVVYAVCGATESIVDHTLEELERRLHGVMVRLNRRDLLAIDRIDRIVADGDGAATVETRDGARWRVSRRRTAAVREALVR